LHSKGSAALLTSARLCAGCHTQRGHKCANVGFDNFTMPGVGNSSLGGFALHL
jgi:hypothetical protein